MSSKLTSHRDVLFLKRPYDLFPLIMVHVKEGLLRTLLIKKSQPQFPKAIGSYQFVSLLKKEGVRKSYALAIYQSKNGKKAIAKMTNIQIKGYHYYSLLNEILMYEILYTVRARVRRKIPKDISHIMIPKLLHVVETEEYLLALIEFFEGVPAQEKSDEKRVAIYLSIVNFLDFLGKHMTSAEKKHVSKRTGYNYVLLYPLLVVKAILTYPESAVVVLSGIPIFVSAIPKLLKTPWTSFSHRDLHFLNILVSKNHTALIDLQQCVFTNKHHEYITTLKEAWGQGSFYKLLLKEVFKRYSEENDFILLFKAFSVNAATHALTGSGFPKYITKGWINYLKFCINFDEKSIKKIL